MRTILNIALGVLTLWIATSLATEANHEILKQIESHKSQFHDTVYESNGDTAHDKEESSSRETTVPQVVSNTTTSAAPTTGLSPKTTSSVLTSSVAVTMNEYEIQELNRILEQSESTPKIPLDTKQPTAFSPEPSSTEHHSTGQDTNSAEQHSTLNASSLDDMLTNAKSNSVTSAPDVVPPTKGTKTYLDNIFKQSLAWLGDTYTLSIVVPILAGFLFAIVIIITLFTFACIRRRCRRRRLRRKLLPETIRNMGASDRAKLLAETSDEEF